MVAVIVVVVVAEVVVAVVVVVVVGSRTKKRKRKSWRSGSRIVEIKLSLMPTSSTATFIDTAGVNIAFFSLSWS